MLRALLIKYICFTTFGFCNAQQHISHTLYFNTDKFSISESEQQRLQKFIKSFENTNVYAVSIYGYCDDRGFALYNLTLSQQRADAIKKIFGNYNINKNVITNVDGKGEILLTQAKNLNINELRRLNRKVEIMVHKFAKSIIKANPNNSSAAEVLNNDLKIGDIIQFKNIYFKTSSAQILPESQDDLDAIAAALLKRKNLKFSILGHVCCIKDNKDAIDKDTGINNLSHARARFIYKYFITKGISAKRMKYMGLGHLFPLGGESKYDKRVEIEILEVAN